MSKLSEAKATGSASVPHQPLRVGRALTTEGESRVRLRTRSRLIAAAEAVMAKRGVDGATIQEITDEAELGTGTFYNHFNSKEELAREVFATRAEELARLFDFISRTVEDPARVICYIERVYIEKSLRDPIWGWFLIHVELALRQMEETFRERARADLMRGIGSKRFSCESCIDTAVSITLSSLVSTTKNILEGRASTNALVELPELLLRMIGVPAEEAAALAREPLPDFDTLISADGDMPAPVRKSAGKRHAVRQK